MEAIWCCLMAVGGADHPDHGDEYRTKVAVLDTEIVGLEEGQGKVFSEVLTAEIDALGRFDIISGNEILTMLGFENQKMMLGCEDSSCMAELGGAVGADFLVYSNVGLVGSTYVVSVKLIASTPSTLCIRIGYLTSAAATSRKWGRNGHNVQ